MWMIKTQFSTFFTVTRDLPYFPTYKSHQFLNKKQHEEGKKTCKSLQRVSRIYYVSLLNQRVY